MAEPPGFDWIDGVLVPRPGTCPYPLSADMSVEWCIANGHCGCDERDTAARETSMAEAANKKGPPAEPKRRRTGRVSLLKGEV